MHRNVEQVTKEEIQKSFQLLKFSKFSTTHGWIYYLEDKCRYCHTIYDFVIQCCYQFNDIYMYIYIIWLCSLLFNDVNYWNDI